MIGNTIDQLIIDLSQCVCNMGFVCVFVCVYKFVNSEFWLRGMRVCLVNYGYLKEKARVVEFSYKIFKSIARSLIVECICFVMVYVH